MSGIIKGSTRINNIILEEVCNYITNLHEIIDKEIETEYDIINTQQQGNFVEIYRFKTTKGTSYDIEFFDTFVAAKQRFINKKTGQTAMFNDFVNDKFLDEKSYFSMDIGFVPTNRKTNNITHQDYIKNTNKYEQLDVFGRLIYLLNEYIKDNPHINIYAFGNNTDKNKINVYLRLYNKLFSKDFENFSGESLFYKNGSEYFINKKILK